MTSVSDHRAAPYPFAALVGQEDLKLCLLLTGVDPRLGGVLLRGEKGTAKSTASSETCVANLAGSTGAAMAHRASTTCATASLLTPYSAGMTTEKMLKPNCRIWQHTWDT